MNAPLQHWQVLPHGRPTRIGDNMLTVTGDIYMPLVELPRRMTVVRLQGARAKVQELVAVDTVAPNFKDPDVDFMVVPGTRGHEAALMVRGADDGCTLILNDVVGNIRDAKGFGGWLLRLAGFAGDEPHVPSVVKMTVVNDTQALRLQLMEWAAMPTLTRMVVSHGDIIEDNPRQVLRELATSLD